MDAQEDGPRGCHRQISHHIGAEMMIGYHDGEENWKEVMMNIERE